MIALGPKPSELAFEDFITTFGDFFKVDALNGQILERVTLDLLPVMLAYNDATGLALMPTMLDADGVMVVNTEVILGAESQWRDYR